MKKNQLKKSLAVVLIKVIQYTTWKWKRVFISKKLKKKVYS